MTCGHTRATCRPAWTALCGPWLAGVASSIWPAPPLPLPVLCSPLPVAACCPVPVSEHTHAPHQGKQSQEFGCSEHVIIIIIIKVLVRCPSRSNRPRGATLYVVPVVRGTTGVGWTELRTEPRSNLVPSPVQGDPRPNLQHPPRTNRAVLATALSRPVRTRTAYYY